MRAELDHILIKGAREHNLKNVTIKIPKKKFVVVTGVSGSGKSSLALDTLYAEGQRRYVESLSAYARQFLGQMEKPHYDAIKGLAPAIAIEQKATSKNPRSTVGTITEVYDYLRVLFARIGTQYCHKCGKEVGRGDPTTMLSQILEMEERSKIILLAPMIENRKGEHKELLDNLKGQGYTRARVNGVLTSLDEIHSLEKNKKHTIEVVVDRFVLKKTSKDQSRILDSIEQGLRVGSGKLIVHQIDGKEIFMNEARSCCGHSFKTLEPTLFSFNSPIGMCHTCNGIGSELIMDEKKIVADPSLTIREGAVIPWQNYFLYEEEREGSWGFERLKALERELKIDLDKPWNKLTQKIRNIILHGLEGKTLVANWSGNSGQGTWKFEYEGLIPTLFRRYKQTKSEEMKKWYGKFLSMKECTSCHGQRLIPEVLSVKINNKSIMEVCALTIQEAYNFLKKLKLKGNQKLIAAELLHEIIVRLKFLLNVGLDYLTLDRKGPTLSGGEAQRIRLASQIGSELTGVMYILDEPSIGLHQRDNQKLIDTFLHLRDIGNSVIVIEHDQETMEASDWLIDLGPGAGHLGGEVVAQGKPAEVSTRKHSLTGQYLSGRKSIDLPKSRRKPTKDRWITIKNAEENNLTGVTAEIPLGLFTCITGVSGAGKSTLINQILLPALQHKLLGSHVSVGKHDSITGLNHIDKVICIDQKPIGKTPRSNPATYTKVFDHIRDLFALLPEAKAKGYQKGRFSFNVKGGRCEHCQGDGFIKVEMHFLADVFVPCEVCHGKRFNDATLQIKYKGHSISDVLELTVLQARELFENHPKIAKILDTLLNVGLGYIKLGQAATTLSGGEAQRIKLSRELAKRSTGKTLYTLDEPTTGLHFDDIKKLLHVLQQLTDAGNSVLVIEHNLDVIKSADWIIDLGPEGGFKGGQIIAKGTPDQVSKVKKSYTGQFLKQYL